MLQRYLAITMLCIFSYTLSFAQSAADYAVQITATVQESPAQIKLYWKPITGTTSYTVYRKAKTATTWSALPGTLTAADTSYTDNNVAVNEVWEYKVARQGTTPASSSGYICAGIKAPALHSKGALLLLVDSTFTDSCKTEIRRLMKDLSGDGWEVLRNDYNRAASATTIKNYIISTSQSNSSLAAVLILGHIAVPYSGEINPDGHPDHLGAWPADVFYGELNGSWTDNTVNNSSASRAQNKNIPGDGKWDQSNLPSDVELQVSRIDFANMPAFAKTEVQLMRSYLNRDHIYKMDSLNIIHRALIYDNFGAFSGEAFAANGWRNFIPMVGRDNVKSLPFISTLNTNVYQWAYGCGGGSYTSASGVGNTTDFTTNNVNSIFTLLFGSYFGDWDAQNNFMRAPLCSNTPALTSCWAGRPNWFMHHMALGENIGYATRLSQNNTNLYTPANYGAQFVHIALMGDLSLRTDYIQPPGNVVLTGTAGGAHLTWTASPDPAVIGYYVYRSATEFGAYEKRSDMLTGTSFNDSSGTNGTQYYMVRAVKLQQTPSGKYYNLSIGNTSSANITYPIPSSGVQQLAAIMQPVLYPNPASAVLNADIYSAEKAQANIIVTNMSGAIVLKTKAQLKTGGNKISLDIKNLVPGNYIFTIEANGYDYSTKWLKMSE